MVGVIYRLKDGHSGEVRYIGQSSNWNKRFAQHKTSFKKKLIKGKILSQIENWIHNLYMKGIPLEMEIIEWNIPIEELDHKEILYIEEYKKFNFNLVNSTKGGSGKILRGTKINVSYDYSKMELKDMPYLSYDQIIKIKEKLMKMGKFDLKTRDFIDLPIELIFPQINTIKLFDS